MRAFRTLVLIQGDRSVRGATEGINLVAKSWEPRTSAPATKSSSACSAGHANTTSPAAAVAEKGARLRVIPDDNGDLILEEYESCFNSRTWTVAATRPERWSTRQG